MGLFQALHAYFLSPVLTLLILLAVAAVLIQWLIQFDITPPGHPLVRSLMRVHDAVLGPLLRPIRRAIPPLGGVLDVGPMVLILGLSFLNSYLIPAVVSVLP